MLVDELDTMTCRAVSRSSNGLWKSFAGRTVAQMIGMSLILACWDARSGLRSDVCPRWDGTSRTLEQMNPAAAQTVLEVNGLSYTILLAAARWTRCDFPSPAAKSWNRRPQRRGNLTLLLHFNGLLPQRPQEACDATNGAAVRVNGLPVASGHLAEVRRLVGFLFQDPMISCFVPRSAKTSRSDRSTWDSSVTKSTPHCGEPRRGSSGGL